jgi:Tol biopolymer transport system component
MGEVYRARDTKLKRDVALKVLPDAYARDPGRMARFQREAEVLASLNHPNIAQIYGVEERALVMELVEGEAPKGPMQLEDAWKIASQIADALAYAHERGVMHRDLKPVNIKVTPEGVVKLLDFGLAKALADPPRATNPADSPTVTMGGTVAGVILGTAAYMSPEQARGKPLDERTDIWSFGVVLYELLTGRKLFQGDTVSDILASVLKETPDWRPVPPEARRLLRSCLQKDPKLRLHDIADAKLLLEEAPPARSTSVASKLAWIAAAVLFVVLAALAVVRFREVPAAREQVRLQIPLPEKATYNAFSISPDGRKVVFVARANGVSRLWLRSLDSLDIRPLAGTETGATIGLPFWSPDSRSIAFSEGSPVGTLKKIDILGGPAQSLCAFSTNMVGGNWSPEGVILFGTRGGIMRVSSSSGSAALVTAVDSARGEQAHILPAVLPDGRHFLYQRLSYTLGESGIYVGSLDSKPEQQNRKLILATDAAFAFVPPTVLSQNARLLFLREGALLAQTFDLQKLKLTGEPTPVTEKLDTDLFLGDVGFSASQNGVMIYRAGVRRDEQFTWFDRQGKTLGTVGDSGQYQEFALSPDGMKVAASEIRSGNRDIWILDTVSGGRTRFTSDPALDLAPRWSPDGTRIVFTSNRAGHMDLYVKASDSAGTEQLLYQSNDSNVRATSSWSRDGRELIFTLVAPKLAGGLIVLPVEGNRTPLPFLRNEFSVSNGDFSPDGRWVAYDSTKSGRPEVYVRSFPTGGEVLISLDGGRAPRWSRDGKELFFRTMSGRLLVVSVTINGAEIRTGKPQPMFDVPMISNVGSQSFEVGPDAKRFLFKVPVEQRASPLTVVLNWDAGLKK